MSGNSSADILGKLEAKYLGHPGIPRYIINSLDYPELAERGVFVQALSFLPYLGRRGGKIAPSRLNIPK